MNKEHSDTRHLQESAFREEEMLIPDIRADLTPAQIVESKLVSLLKGASMPVSYLQTRLQRGPR